MTSLTQKAAIAASPLLILFAFALPLSTSAGSILAILLILAWITSGKMAEKFDEILRNPVTIAVLIYILLHVLGLLWSEDLDWGFKILKKQWKLLLFPVFLTIAKKEHTKYYMAAFIAAIFLKACKAYLVWLGVISLPPSSVFTTLGTTHVMYNPMLALACYILLQNLIFAANKPVHKILQTGLLIFLSCNMFITAGRTGQIAFFVLLAVILFQYFYKLSKAKLLLGLILLPLLITATYQCSTTFRGRVDLAITEIKEHKSQEITSVGLRVWFYKNTIIVIKENWLTGVGTGDFPTEYAKINKIYSPTLLNTDNPHSQYLLILSQFGIVGFISLISIFFSQLIMAFRQKDALTPLRQAFPIFFLVIMLAESYLMVYGTGFLFSLFSAFLYKNFSHQNS
ncbi:MAG TPA: O-antigen ligase domain-containing protein [Desulfocapsa sulfexigens]|nr:O-antigen ligase domain-containing protein [Desulfocapsa sulfexigens]